MKEYGRSSPDVLDSAPNEKVREKFLIQNLFVDDRCVEHQVREDRLIVFGVMPRNGPVVLSSEAFPDPMELLANRELGIVNIGGPAQITVDESEYRLLNKDALYIGRGGGSIVARSTEAERPAKLFCMSCPAHREYPNRHVAADKVVSVDLGEKLHSNERTILKAIVPENVESCQLLMGITTLKPGSVWNTMPPHLHDKRMEVYCYFELDDEVVFHFMGSPGQIRHLTVRNEEAIISPSWSIHSGVGTGSYSFIWAMAGENRDFSDMQPVQKSELI